jgi:hypothetical protein
MEKIYVEELKTRNYSEYKQKMFSENNLLNLAEVIKRNESDIFSFVYNLLEDLALTKPYNKYFDWNIGSTIQHFDPLVVISAFKKLESPYLTDSIGLSWVFGEFKLNDPIIRNFLHKVIKNGRDSEAWWRAAFSLEKISNEDAVTLLKRDLKAKTLKELSFYFQNIKDKKSIIGILLKCTSLNLRTEIYPFLKNTFLSSEDKLTLINCAWLLGRFKLLDKDIIDKIVKIINDNEDYELVYYTFFAIQELASPKLIPVFKEFLNDKDALLRKMAIRGLSYINGNENLLLLEEAFLKEDNPYVLSEISQGLYRGKNVFTKNMLALKQTFNDIENGLIIDDSDKWYADPTIYEVFSLAEDPENICFRMIEKYVKSKFDEIRNPIDLATGTGRAFRYFINKINYSGKYYAVDRSVDMLNYLEKVMNRNHGYIFDFDLINSSLVDLDLNIESDFIISSFGFPSKFTNKELCRKELESVYNLLSDNGVFITLGWDESFNDELNYYWFKYIPDEIGEFDFERWRRRRASEFDSPRNCNLSWYKTGITVPLQYHNLKESVQTMGHLFGRDAAENIIDNQKTEWTMSLGITLNTKEDIRKILNI